MFPKTLLQPIAKSIVFQGVTRVWLLLILYVTATHWQLLVVETRMDLHRFEVSCPQAVKLYNRFMGGVDLADRSRKAYSTARKSVMMDGPFPLFAAYCIAKWIHPHQASNKLQKEFHLDVLKNCYHCLLYGNEQRVCNL